MLGCQQFHQNSWQIKAQSKNPRTIVVLVV